MSLTLAVRCYGSAYRQYFSTLALGSFIACRWQGPCHGVNLGLFFPFAVAGFAELPEALADGSPDLWKLSYSKYNQNNEQNESDFHGSKTSKHLLPPIISDILYRQHCRITLLTSLPIKIQGHETFQRQQDLLFSTT